MYTLRIIKKDLTYGTSNTYLGKHFIVSEKLHLERVQGADEDWQFDHAFRTYFAIGDAAVVDKDSEDYNKIALFVTGDNGSVLMPVYNSDQAYIMSESGKTFQRLN